MFIIYGFYRFAQKRIGYRMDFCLTCQWECIAEQWRSFNCGHLFWIPILPFGFSNRWLCPYCKSNPHYRFGSRSIGEILSSVFGILTLLVLIAVIGNCFYHPKPDQDESYRRGIQFMVTTLLILGGLFSLCLTWTLRYRDPILDEKLPALKPAPLDVCVYCQARLSSESFCETCQVTRSSVLP